MTAEPTKLEVALLLAKEQSELYWETSAVYWFPNEEHIWLIVVSTVVSYPSGEVLPFLLASEPPDVPYKHGMILLHPDDWDKKELLDWHKFDISAIEKLYEKGPNMYGYVE